MHKQGLLLLLTLYFFSGCSGIRFIRSARKPLSTTNFTDTIPVEFHNDNILVPVEVAGKTRKFLLDTASGTVIFSSLGEDMAYIKKRKVWGNNV
jgi:hypothetical protein